jgi:hypothetical protein
MSDQRTARRIGIRLWAAGAAVAFAAGLTIAAAGPSQAAT